MIDLGRNSPYLKQFLFQSIASHPPLAERRQGQGHKKSPDRATGAFPK
jgi:hypothetical protein